MPQRSCRCSGASGSCWRPAAVVPRTPQVPTARAPRRAGSASASFAAYENCLKSHGVTFSGRGFGPGGPGSGSPPSSGNTTRTTLSPSEQTAFQKASAACASLRPKFNGTGAGSTAVRRLPQLPEAPRRHPSCRPRRLRLRWGHLDVHHHQSEAAGRHGGMRRAAAQGRVRRQISRLHKHHELTSDVCPVSDRRHEARGQLRLRR